MNLVSAMNRLFHSGGVRAAPASVLSPLSPHDPHAPARGNGGNGECPVVPATLQKTLTGSLRPQEIVLDVDVHNAAGALNAAAASIGRAHGLDPAPILRALSRREQVGSTALGSGVAIPHARIAGITEPLTLFMRTRYAIEFGAPDGRPVTNLLVIMVPADGDTDEHLQFLALVAETFTDRAFRTRLAAATTAGQVDEVFVEWQRQRMK